MIGIQQIAYYIPQDRHSNYNYLEKFSLDSSFIEEKLGVRQVSVSSTSETTFNLCTKAYTELLRKVKIDPDEIECISVVTQTPEENIPHVSGKIHGYIGSPPNCACFDISLGCSGYVYGLTILKGLMELQGYKKGLLFTCDPYSKIVNPNDRNTSLLFGDAATVTLLSNKPAFNIGVSTNNTLGKSSGELKTEDGHLVMNGRAVYNFCVQNIPNDIKYVSTLNGVTLEDIDIFVLHQGSKFIVDSIRNRLGIPPEKAPFFAYEYGNTVSSSIPIILSEFIDKNHFQKILISGFGVGLSWASNILTRV
ncbi:MAG: ketoacyl-ACP synthase III [Nostoc sp. RI_552]|nr:ketoacyl-ACP synthase III [Nostoc sp. RI_552]